MVPKWKYDEAIDLGRTNAEAEALNEWQNKQDVATRVSELDLQHKLEEANKEIERITENNYVEPLRNLSVTVNGVNYEII